MVAKCPTCKAVVLEGEYRCAFCGGKAFVEVLVRGCNSFGEGDCPFAYDGMCKIKPLVAGVFPDIDYSGKIPDGCPLRSSPVMVGLAEET